MALHFWSMKRGRRTRFERVAGVREIVLGSNQELPERGFVDNAVFMVVKGTATLIIHYGGKEIGRMELGPDHSFDAASINPGVRHSWLAGEEGVVIKGTTAPEAMDAIFGI